MIYVLVTLPVSSENINKRNYFQHRTTNNNIYFFSKIETASCRSFLIKAHAIFVTIEVFSFRTYYEFESWTRFGTRPAIPGVQKFSDFQSCRIMARFEDQLTQGELTLGKNTS